MAMLATLQCHVATTRMPIGSTRSYSYARTAAPTLPSRRRSVRVRCQGEGDDQTRSPLTPEQQPASPVAPPKQPTPAASAAPKPAAAKKESTSFSEVLAFSGPAPERINGRLAMVGFVAAMAVEAARGDSLLAQVGNGGLPWFLGTAALLSAASLVPMFKGVTAQSRSGGLMTADAELWNGRFAMLGLVALAFTEYLKGGPLV